MNQKTVIALLSTVFYVEVCAITTVIPFPKPRAFPPEPPAPVIIEPNPYENDCWGVEDDYCWWYPYDI